MYHVLIADDEPLMRKALEVMIYKVAGFEVKYSVGFGELAVEICKNNKVDIVFMDIMMPGESGIECSKKIYEHNPKVSIFIISSYNSFEFAIEALNSKVKAYISKPVSFPQIEGLLKNYLIENNKINTSSKLEKHQYEGVFSIIYEELISIIKEKNFKKVYYDISKIIEELDLEKKDNVDSLKEYFVNLGQQLINSTSILGEETRKVNELFPIDDFFARDKKFFEFWLFKVMNYVFQKNSIKKYNLLKRILDYIEMHIEAEIGLNEIISNCSVSQGYLSRIFKGQFNVSVMEYLHMRKMYMAKNYFCFTDLKITDVAFKLGYNESSYFSKVFKKYENITVYQYKNIAESKFKVGDVRNMNEYFITSESVTEGHPDKICDQISDAILDAYLEKDRNSRVAVECMVSKNTIMIAGEITSNAKVDVVKIAREVVKNIGYCDEGIGFDYKTCLIFTNINTQSLDIALGVDKEKENEKSSKGILGAGDQGIMYGYACNETENYMPLTCELANKLVMKLAVLRKEEGAFWLRPDGKAQITMKYDENGKPLKISSIVISAQHDENIDYDFIKNTIKYDVIYSVIDNKWLSYDTKIYINPTGRFVTGGPAGDSGLTGRKIMVDTYGGIGRHGGGAFSGKDPTKVDRSAAYMARYVAKNIVGAKLAEKVEVSMSYVIGCVEPQTININTFGTETIKKEYINEIVKDTFSFAVANILEQLDLRKPQFLKTAVYGHFGRENENFKWEELDKVQVLKEKALKYVLSEFI